MGGAGGNKGRRERKKERKRGRGGTAEGLWRELLALVGVKADLDMESCWLGRRTRFISVLMH